MTTRDKNLLSNYETMAVRYLSNAGDMAPTPTMIGTHMGFLEHQASSRFNPIRKSLAERGLIVATSKGHYRLAPNVKFVTFDDVKGNPMPDMVTIESLKKSALPKAESHILLSYGENALRYLGKASK